MRLDLFESEADLMRSFPRSKVSVTLSLFALAALLASLLAFQTGSTAANAASASANLNSTLLKLTSLGTTHLTTGSSSAVSSGKLEVSPVGDDQASPKAEVSGQKPPLNPPPANTPPPNPAGQHVTSHNPGFTGFNGLSHYDQRYAGTGAYANTQFSLEPPDQGLCVSNKFVLDSINTALAVRTTSGKILSGPTPINQFFGLAPEVNRSTITFGNFTSDPKCYFDSATQHWFLTVLEIDTDPATGAQTGPSHTLIAVSETSDPTGDWRMFSFNTTNDGTDGTPSHASCPCFGDQPLIGADANGFYVTTNEFSLVNGSFNGSQVYAISKKALVEAASHPNVSFSPAVVLIDASQALAPYGGLSYSLQPATQPAGSYLGRENDGTEYFLSALQFVNTVDNRIAVWALTNTESLDRSFPNVSLSFKVITSQLYGQPVPVTQKAGPTPYATSQGAPEGYLNSNDDRMNQVVYAAGVLWSGVNTIIQVPGQVQRTGIAYFGVVPFWHKGQLDASLAKSGYVSVAGNNVLFPSIGMNSRGEGVMSFTLSGPDYYPSAAYMPISLWSTGDIHIAAAGAAPEDGFTCIPGQVCRWGDYSAAVASPDGSSIWLATEYIPNTTRTQIANWGTFVSRVEI
jgi:hypothetical protein